MQIQQIITGILNKDAMKNSFLFIIIISIFVLLIKACSDDTVQPGGGNTETDPGIYMTDEFGNFLGGDTTDWCLSSGNPSVFSFGPAYPNPTAGRTVTIKFQSPAADTVKLFFLKSNTDSIVFFNGAINAGYYQMLINDSTNLYSNTYQRIYFSSKRFSSSQYCRFYGDIKFTP